MNEDDNAHEHDFPSRIIPQEGHTDSIEGAQTGTSPPISSERAPVRPTPWVDAHRKAGGTSWRARLQQLSELQNGWNGDGSHRLSRRAIAVAWEILNRVDRRVPTPLAIGPTDDGGVLVETIDEKRIRSAEVMATGAIELFTMHANERTGTLTVTRDKTIASRFLMGAL